MQAQPPHGPRVSRETRLLFATVIASVIALWVLARFRFPEHAVSVNPVAPVFNQLAPAPAYSDLAAVVSEVQARVLPPLLPVRLTPRALTDTGTSPRTVPALRVRDEVAIALMDQSVGYWRNHVLDNASLLNVDRATGLATLKVPSMPVPELTDWSAARLTSPRYLLSTEAVPQMVSLRPVFVSTLGVASSTAWQSTVWSIPGNTPLVPGAFVFTTTGAFAGLIIAHDGGLAILPPAATRQAVTRLLEQRQGEPGWIGVDVQPLTTALRDATGATRGVVVTWVDPVGPAAGSILIGDVVENAEDPASEMTIEQFRVRTARLLVGDSITLQVRRGQLAQPVRLTAIERPAASAMGLTMRRVRLGAEVVEVEPRSIADTAGIRAGDVITFAGGVQNPTPAQVARAFAAAAKRTVLVGIARNETHLVLAVNQP